MRQRFKTKDLTVLAVLSALAFLVMWVGRIPVVLFLKYDPKDVIIVIGGFLYGPTAAFCMSVVVSFFEMLTVSSTGWIGLVMNILSTCAFVCTAAYLYGRKRSIKSAVIGLAAGALLMTAVMLLWNYFLTPIYMGTPREAVAELLLPVLLPFNLLKSGLNAGIAMLIYKPVSTALRKQRLLPAHEGAKEVKGKAQAGVIALSLFVIATCVLFILVLQGKI